MRGRGVVPGRRRSRPVVSRLVDVCRPCVERRLALETRRETRFEAGFEAGFGEKFDAGLQPERGDLLVQGGAADPEPAGGLGDLALAVDLGLADEVAFRMPGAPRRSGRRPPPQQAVRRLRLTAVTMRRRSAAFSCGCRQPACRPVRAHCAARGYCRATGYPLSRDRASGSSSRRGRRLRAAICSRMWSQSTPMSSVRSRNGGRSMVSTLRR